MKFSYQKGIFSEKICPHFIKGRQACGKIARKPETAQIPGQTEICKGKAYR